jgi:hypothetical protein
MPIFRTSNCIVTASGIILSVSSYSVHRARKCLYSTATNYTQGKTSDGHTTQVAEFIELVVLETTKKIIYIALRKEI